MSDETKTTDPVCIDAQERRKFHALIGVLLGIGFALWFFDAISWAATHPGTFLWWSWQ